jgi:hypothetical protein
LSINRKKRNKILLCFLIFFFEKMLPAQYSTG